MAEENSEKKEVNFTLRFFYDEREHLAQDALEMLKEAGISEKSKYAKAEIYFNGCCSADPNKFNIYWGPTGNENNGYDISDVKSCIRAFNRVLEKGLITKLND